MRLVNTDRPYWLVGMTEMTRTFGLELLESVLSDFQPVFYKVIIVLISNYCQLFVLYYLDKSHLIDDQNSSILIYYL